MRKFLTGLALAGFCVAGLACRDQKPPHDPPGPPEPTTAPPTQAATSKPTTKPFVAINEVSLPNAHWVNKKVLSGAQPEGEEGFVALQKLGIKTVISVDGAAPDIESAHKYGMRYVHLPFGYDGVPEIQGKALAKAINEMPGPVYVHCHHGKHRSAAGIAVACVYNGMLPPSEAELVLKTWGTGKNYKGLWADALKARPLDPSELTNLKVTFVERAKIPAIAEAMVNVDFYFDHLKDIKKAGWTSPPSHPDLDPPHEALQLEEQFVEIGRMESTAAHPPEFQEWMALNAKQVKALGELLKAQPVDTAAANKAIDQIGKTCLSCHAKYRD